MKIGLTSVTFRGFDCAKIIKLACQAKLYGMEWGGDVHVPPGDLQHANKVRSLTEDSGLKILSYGSYFRVGDCGDVHSEFEPVLGTALALRAPLIRVWAGSKEFVSSEDEYFQKAVRDSCIIAEMAEQNGITVAYEYHRGTLTNCCKGAMSLIDAVHSKFLRTYWQPNPDLTFENNISELERISSFLGNVHVFYWDEKGTRLPLVQGAAEWGRYIDIIESSGTRPMMIMEFVKDGSARQFLRDAQVLQNLLAERGK